MVVTPAWESASGKSTFPFFFYNLFEMSTFLLLVSPTSCLIAFFFFTAVTCKSSPLSLFSCVLLSLRWSIPCLFLTIELWLLVPLNHAVYVTPEERLLMFLFKDSFALSPVIMHFFLISLGLVIALYGLTFILSELPWRARSSKMSGLNKIHRNDYCEEATIRNESLPQKNTLKRP